MITNTMINTSRNPLKDVKFMIEWRIECLEIKLKII